MASEDMKAIARFAYERGIYVISDECYVYLNYTGEEFSLGSLTEVKDRLLVVGSLSKTYAMTGWRLGFTLGPAAVVSQMQKLQSQSTSNPTSIVQKAAVAALNGPQECVAEMRADYIKLRDKIVSGLRAIPGVTCTMPQGAFYAYPDISGAFGKAGMKSAADVAKKLLHEAHVVTVPGEAFGTTKHIRLSYAASHEAVECGLERMNKFFSSL
jgi:aspartate aminotransferase